MKKKYLSPGVKFHPVSPEEDILVGSYTGQSTTDLTVVDETEESDWVF